MQTYYIKALKADFIKNNQFLSLLISSSGLVILFLNTLLEHKPPIFDEGLYVHQDIVLINQLGISIEFLRSSKVAVGPLTTIIHYLLQPITHIQVPSIRFVNFFLLICILLILIGSLKILGYAKPHFHVMGMISAPILWPVSGMALSEIPSMFFSSLGLYLFLLAFSQEFDSKWTFLNQKYPVKLIASLLGGLLFSFSILGRQTFLVGLLAFPILLIQNVDKRKYVYAFLFAALILPIVVFTIWGGIVPPFHQAKPGYISKETFSIVNGFLSFAYAAIIIAIIAPKIFVLDKKSLLITIFLSTIIFIINFFFDFIAVIPAKSVATKIFADPLYLTIYSKISSGILVVCGLIFLIVIFKMIFNNKYDLIYIFLCIYFLLLCATPFKIVHLFSSRYTATTLPIMMIITARYSSTNDIWKPIRLIVGIMAGFLLLRSFFDVH